MNIKILILKFFADVIFAIMNGAILPKIYYMDKVAKGVRVD